MRTRARGRVCRLLAAAALLLNASAGVMADEARDAALAQRDQAEQLERWRRDRERLAAQQGQSQAARWQDPVAGESPCFAIYAVTVVEAEADKARRRRGAAALLGPVQGLGRFEGACLGVQSIQVLRANLQARLAERGYITTQLSVPPQDLSQGLLVLELLPGYVESVQVVGPQGRGGPAVNALAFDAGDMLNLRDIEHTLENLGRLPSQTARFVVEPGSEPGASVVRILVNGGPRWRGNAGLNSADSHEYGRWQGNTQWVYDAPLSLSDQLSVSVSAAFKSEEGERPRQLTAFVYWSVPFGRHLAALSGSTVQHKRFVAGGVGRFSESGSDDQVRLRWQWTPWRDAGGRWQVWGAGASRRSRTYLDDIELIGRRRIGSSIEYGASWWGRHSCGEVTLEAESVRATRLERDEEFQAPLTALPRRWEFGAQWSCRLGSGWDLGGNAALQRASQPVDGSDLLVLGSRNTVRGHPLSASLSGTGATYVRNELSFPAWQPNDNTALRPWVGVDWGRIHQPIAGESLPHELAGFAAGLRWQAADFSGEITAAWPLDSGSPRGGARWFGSVRAVF